ncbi:hypothetical protein GCM10027169_37330 [Gordonia jinhuaensis]|uniref:DNA primase/polymerase bifunctional N-terminal domain-containing protein n=1 Tax=Gordonia jinhuaensis TaxID=1517702 RepID=A0A916T2V1_9ACTN|nr:bifunctional DNA primase/polymerase [Gordonia jinhuaensis]GGB26312.1 hypothetical protein GCM10011489_13100 [Gordonia jinhuaensis]
MLGATRLTAVLGSGVDPTDREAMRNYLREGASAGLSLLFVQPSTKVPADPRTVRSRNRANKAAREAAQAAGRGDWRKVRAPAGLALATAKDRTLLAYLDQYFHDYPGQPVNLAVEVGGSRLIVVDCDTPQQRAAFLGMAEAPDVPPTIVTPGGGGHFYFTVPEGIELPRTAGAMTLGHGEGAFAVLWDRRYVLVPPSIVDGRRYEALGREYPAPDWLIEKIIERGHARHERRIAEDHFAEGVDLWAEMTPWSMILEPLGWTRVARPDSCGCDVWTAPGERRTARSATAHDSGCSLGRYTEINAPLHIWSHFVGEPFERYIDERGTYTLSKLQAVTYADFDGDTAWAVSQLELLPDVEIDFAGVAALG